MKNNYYNQHKFKSNRMYCFAKHITTLLCAGVVFLTTSCNKFLDVRPEGELPEKQLLKDANGFEAAMFGVYGTMNSDLLYGGQLSFNTTEVLAQYFVCSGNTFADNLGKYNYSFSNVESTLEGIWSKAYANISYTNNVLKNLERFSPQTLEYYNLYKGEALGMRAFLHFDLVRLFGENVKLDAGAKGIPYSTDFALKAPEFVSLAKVYDNIITDLTEAETLLKEDEQLFTFPKSNPQDPYLRDRETHFNLYAVQATLARVYLTKGDNVNAALYAEKVINSGKFPLLDKTDIANGVGKGVLYPKETIFGLFSNKYFEVVRDRFLQQTTFFSYDNRSNISNIYNDIQGGHDYRWDAFFKLPATQIDKLRFTKLVDPFQQNDQEYLRPADRIKGINLIRIPEMYYIAAEALLNTNPDKARTYFDAVIKSRGLVALSEKVTAEDLTLNMITNDRYKEFIGEGQTFFNMKRLNLDIVNAASQTVPASKAVYVLPIPKIENNYRN